MKGTEGEVQKRKAGGVPVKAEPVYCKGAGGWAGRTGPREKHGAV